MKTYIVTHSGIEFDLVNPTPEMICFEDIAHALSNINRFNGHTCRPYSVAEHSVRCAAYASDCGLDRDVQLQLLIHDFSEAYYQDISSPLKSLLGKVYSDLEDNCQHLIRTMILGENYIERSADVHRIDHCMGCTEFRDLIGGRPWWPEGDDLQIKIPKLGETQGWKGHLLMQLWSKMNHADFKTFLKPR